jgi:radical SAM superfamily enzyme YgiQ (UPF0313 family)
MTKHVVLFFPNLNPAGTEASSLMPLSLLYVAAPLQQAGFEVSIVDARVVDDWRAALQQRIEAVDPICVGVSTLTGAQLVGAIAASKLVRSLDRDLPIVWGGVHPSLLPLETIREPYIDFIVVGEGEATFPELVQRIAAGGPHDDVEGIWFKDAGTPKSTPERKKVDLNEVPHLDYRLLDIPKYYRPFWDNEPTGPTFITSRGCPYACAYCYIEVFDKRLWRPIQPDRVRENMVRLVEQTGANTAFCLDDMFFTDIRRVKAICREFVDAGLKLHIDNVNCRADAVLRWDDEVAELLAAAGVRRLFVGLETGSDRMLKLIQKGSTRKAAIDANRILARTNIKPIYAFMAGFPNETVADMQDTLSLMAQLLDENPAALITETSFYTPFPGTTLYGEAKRLGVQLPTSVEGWATMSYSTLVKEFFSPAEIDFLHKVKTLSAYVDPKNYETTRHSNKSLVKRLAAKVIAKEFQWRIRNQRFSPFPERWLLAPPTEA